MFVNTLFRRLTFICVSLILAICIGIYVFYPVLTSNSIPISFSLNEFDIAKDKPELWIKIKQIYVITYIISSIICSNTIYSFLFKKEKVDIEDLELYNLYDKKNLCLLIGNTEDDKQIYLSEKSLYQNILITGTIGTGKTSSSIYPFTKQLIEYKHDDLEQKLGMLILDVKGNYYLKILEYTKQYNREEDLIVIEINGSIKYNPLDKPHLKASVLANRLKTILTLFSKNNSESYWLDKAEQTLSECIKLCRLYNDGYVTFTELHKLITVPNYYSEKLTLLRKQFILRKIF